MSRAEGLKSIIDRFNFKLPAAIKTAEDRSQLYANEYSLLRPPSAYEIMQIERIKSKAKYCEKCEGLKECQYTDGDRGLEQIIIVNNLDGKLNGNRLYFGVKECRYRAEAEEERKIEARRIKSGLPAKYKYKRKYDLTKEQRQMINRLLKSEINRLYVNGKYRDCQELLSIIGNEYLRLDLTVRYENSLELLSDLRVTSPRYYERMEEVKRADVLILESLSNTLSQYNDEQIGIILSHRNRRGKRSIVSGAKSLHEFKGMSGEELRDYEELKMSSQTE